MIWNIGPCVRAAIVAFSLAGGLLLAPRLALGQDAKPAAPSKPDAAFEKRVKELDQTIEQQVSAGKIAEAVAPAKELLELRQRNRGASHWQTVSARWQYQTLQRLAAQPRGAQEQYVKALKADQKGGQLLAQGKYPEAQSLKREALEVRRRLLGDDHPDTATSYNYVANTLRYQGKYAEAEAMHRKTLAIFIKTLGPDHPYAATSYNDLAATLRDEGKYAEAEAMLRKGLAIFIKAIVPKFGWRGT